MDIRKKAGAVEKVNHASDMTASMKERAREALAGRTGETDDKE